MLRFVTYIIIVLKGEICIIKIFYTNNLYFFCRLIGDYLLPPSNVLPRSYQELCATMRHIGIEYQSIDACTQDHVIYHKEHENATECPEFHTSRYRDDQVTKKVPCKVLCYIPIILRLKRLFRCNSLAQFMNYHARNKSRDAII